MERTKSISRSVLLLLSGIPTSLHVCMYLMHYVQVSTGYQKDTTTTTTTLKFEQNTASSTHTYIHTVPTPASSVLARYQRSARLRGDARMFPNNKTRHHPVPEFPILHPVLLSLLFLSMLIPLISFLLKAIDSLPWNKGAETIR